MEECWSRGAAAPDSGRPGGGCTCLAFPIFVMSLMVSSGGRLMDSCIFCVWTDMNLGEGAVEGELCKA